MAKFGENYRGENGHTPCPICLIHLDNQPMAFQCQNLKNEVEMRGEYKEIFEEDISMEVVLTISNIMKYREQYEQERALE